MLHNKTCNRWSVLYTVWQLCIPVGLNSVLVSYNALALYLSSFGWLQCNVFMLLGNVLRMSYVFVLCAFMYFCTLMWPNEFPLWGLIKFILSYSILLYRYLNRLPRYNNLGLMTGQHVIPIYIFHKISNDYLIFIEYVPRLNGRTITKIFIFIITIIIIITETQFVNNW